MKAIVVSIYECVHKFPHILNYYSINDDSIWNRNNNFIGSTSLRVKSMGLKDKILEKLENFLRTVIIKYWYIDASITIIAFLILLLLEKMKKDKV